MGVLPMMKDAIWEDSRLRNMTMAPLQCPRLLVCTLRVVDLIFGTVISKEVYGD